MQLHMTYYKNDNISIDKLLYENLVIKDFEAMKIDDTLLEFTIPYVSEVYK